MKSKMIRGLIGLAMGSLAFAAIATSSVVPPNLSGSLAGNLAGHSTVSSRGASEYSFNFAVPPGTAGMSPQLGLSYDSENGLDLSGLGWSLTGVSSISRCKKTIATDGVIHQVDLTAQDSYCLNGERLMVISGTEGATAEYRTETESFQRVKSFGSNSAAGPNSWTVETRDGRVMTFGGSSGNATVPAPGKSSNWVWMLAKSQDPHGNYILYEYEALGSGEHFPIRIRYTGNAAAGLAPYNAVDFTYEGRGDVYKGFLLGAAVTRANRLKTVDVRINTAADGTGGTVVRQWLLGYTTSAITARSLLQTVKDCDGTGANCLPPTTFTWTQRDPSQNTFQAAGSGNWGGPAIHLDPPSGSGASTYTQANQLSRRAVMGDFDGDGKTDILYNGAGSTTWNLCKSTGSAFSCTSLPGMPNVPSERFIAGDFNGDGRTDILINLNAGTTGNVNWQLCLSTGTGFNCGTSQVSVMPQTSFSVANSAGGDFNGDGRADVLFIGPTDAASYLCSYSGTAINCATYAASATKYNIPSGDGFTGRVTRMSYDFDGDGLTDFVTYQNYASGIYTTNPKYLDTTDFFFWKAGTTGLTRVAIATSYSGAYGGGSGLVDVNGDVYPELIYTAPAYDSNQVQHYYRNICQYTGAEFLCGSTMLNGATDPAANGISYGSYNGSGLLSMVTQPGTLGMMDLDVAGNLLPYTTWTPSPYIQPGSPCNTALGSFGGDFNGDGVQDLLCYSSTANTWYVSVTGWGGFSDRLATATDGNGLSTTFTYAKGTDPTIVPAGAVLAYPKQNARPSAVVSKLSISAASGLNPGATLDTTYSYSGLRSDLQGRGSLGFETVTTLDVPTGVATKTTYSQDFPTIAQPIQETKTSSGGIVLSQQISAWASFQTQPGVKYPYVRTKTLSGNDLDGTPLPATVSQIGSGGTGTDGIDAYGNVITSSVVATEPSGDKYSTTTNCATYDNRTGATWILGLCTDQLVTRTAPGVATPPAREITATYDAFGITTLTTAQPVDASLALTTTYTPDPNYGVVTKVHQSWNDPFAGPLSRDLTTKILDSRGQFATTVTNALSQSMHFTYDYASGQIATSQDLNNLTTAWKYDAWGRKVEEDLPDSTYSTWAYRTCISECGYGSTATSVVVEQHWGTVNGSPVQVVAPTESFTDSHGRNVFARSWNDAGTEVQREQSVFDGRGFLGKEIAPAMAGSPSGVKTYLRDALGRPYEVDETAADGVSIYASTFTYSGLKAVAKDANNHSRTEVKNALGQAKTVTDALSNAVTYAYEPFGDLLKVTDPAGNSIVNTFDAIGHKTSTADPDLGTWLYKPDPLGRVLQVTDAKSQITRNYYDSLDRLIERAEPDLDSRWAYDTSAYGIGMLGEAYTWLSAQSTKDYRRVYGYDSLSREQNVVTTLDWDYATLTTYDGFGRPATLTHRRSAIGAANVSVNPVAAVDPAPVVAGTAEIQYALSYNARGALSNISRGTSTLWTLNDQDAAGRPRLETFEGGIKKVRGYNAYTARLVSIQTGADNGSGGASPTIQSDAYQYDPVGNVLSRSWLPATGASTVSEAFTFDALDRLQTSGVSGLDTKTFGYDVLGNMTSKTNVGTYTYPSGGARYPHMVSSITGTVAALTNPGFSYDLNGNTVLGLNRSYGWAASNLPLTIDRLTNGTVASAVQRYEFLYGPERQRTRQINRAMSGTSVGAVQRTIYDAGAIEKEVGSVGGTTKIRTYLPNGAGFTEETIAGTNPAASTQGAIADRFSQNDLLGSLEVVTDSSGAVVERLGYDVWGRRRQANGVEMDWSLLGNSAISNVVDHKGFTGQTQLDDLGLVHLNGRVYDPETGRMTSADPTIPNPLDLQSLNRASYVLNGPTNKTDPTGFASDPVDAIARKNRQVRQENATLDSSGAGAYVLNYSGDSSSTAEPKADAKSKDGEQPRTAQATSGAKGHGETVNVTADDARQSIAAGLGNSIAKGLTLGANWVIAAFGDGSTPLLETGHPFEPRSDLFGRQAETIGDGLQAVAGARSFGAMGAETEAGALSRATRCFPAGTKVSTPKGDVNIEDVRVGDTVYTYDLKTGEAAEQKVTELLRNVTYHWVDIQVGSDVIRATRSHPFWVESLHEWVEAADLKSGMLLRLESGQSAAITNISFSDLQQSQPTYNLEVAVNHDYFVGASHVLVHNGDGSYTITFASGYQYVGKGDMSRMQDSAARVAAAWNDRVVATHWTPANGTADSFVQEEMRMRAAGGPGGKTYNVLNSPGNKIAAESGCP